MSAHRPSVPSLSRRSLLAGAAGLGAAGLGVAGRSLAQPAAPAIVVPEGARPAVPYGAMSGDVTGRSAVVWSRTDRPARMIVEYATTEAFADARRVEGPAALESSDYSARVVLTGLPPGQQIVYRVLFQDLADLKTMSLPATGSFRTAPADGRAVSFAFSGDECGQGWGIDRARGGMRLYEAMRRKSPDLFIHSGDQIYADGPLVPEVTLDDGSIWRNVMTEAKSHVAQSLADYRGAFAYNMLDDNRRRFAAEVPFLVQWDDHEVRNNWYPGEILGDRRYTQVQSLSLLAAWSRQAMFEYSPMRIQSPDAERVYRRIAYGPHMDVFMLDQRSYRGPNTPNLQTAMGGEAAFLGMAQLAWLKRGLLASGATWKVIASDMPIGLVVPDGNPDVVKGTLEAWANGDQGAPLGRELELASLFSFIRNNDIRNVVWVTADVHYAAAHHYAPERGQWHDMKPFWEFVAGPINAGTFGPNEYDRTFGLDVRYESVPKDMKQNRSPAEGRQYFGFARIDGPSRTMTVGLHDIDGRELYKVDLEPEA